MSSTENSSAKEKTYVTQEKAIQLRDAELLREYCDKLKINCTEEIKSVLERYFTERFIEGHKPWRAVVGNKRCKPIPIYRSFVFPGVPGAVWRFEWPNITEAALRNELEKLGFVIDKRRITVAVKPLKKGEKMTFAQKWVKKINESYSKYCANEIKNAKTMYFEVISELMTHPKEKIKITEDGIIFFDFKFGTTLSRQCVTALRKLLKDNGIEELYNENGKYRGMIVLNDMDKEEN